MDKQRSYSEIFEVMRTIVPPSVNIYLVGGAVRDMLLNNPIKDYDFVVEGLVRPIGKKLADSLNGSYYVLDDEREIVRVVVNSDTDDYSFCVDIARICGEGLEEDLLARDFTINAIAFDFMKSQTIVDPLLGLTDLKEKRLRMCSPASLEADPIRGMRAIRMALEFDLTMDADLIAALKAVLPLLPTCSMERYRDELGKILAIGKNACSIQLLEKFGFLDFLFPRNETPDIQSLVGWVRSLDHLILILTYKFNEEASSNILSATAILLFGQFRNSLMDYFAHSRRSLLILSTLAGGYGVPEDKTSKDIVKQRGKHLILSSEEIKYASNAFSAFKTLQITDFDSAVSDLEMHRFFGKYGESGIGGFFLFWAEVLSRQDTAQNIDHWKQVLERSRCYFEAWFQRYDEVIKPKKLVSGNELSAALGIASGPKIGMLKKAIIEAQVERKVFTPEDAVAFAKRVLADEA